MSVLTQLPLDLLFAVAVSSFLGSLHCVGMCGPFALMASGTAASRSQATARLTLYHFGRLLTYMTSGAIVGLVGTVITSGGLWIGVQSGAARLAGIAMIALGVLKLVRYSSGNANLLSLRGASTRINSFLASLRGILKSLHPLSRAIVAGSLTTLLPCGWLYVFLLVAGGTGRVGTAILLMVAFWIGTLPALSVLVLGARKLTASGRRWLPLLGSALLIMVGAYTAVGRANADLTPLLNSSNNFTMTKTSHIPVGKVVTTVDKRLAPLDQIDALKSKPLPCCILRNKATAGAD